MKAGNCRYLSCPSEGGEWVVVDRTRDAAAVASCRDKAGAALLAALMNGDLGVLAEATPETLSRCRSALRGSRSHLKAYAWPAIGTGGFPQL